MKYDVQNVQKFNVQNFDTDVQNVQNANNCVQNPVQMSKNRVQNVQNECPKNLDKTSDNVQNSPKNIFIEKNREEENRRNKNRGEENGEKTINNNSLSPSQRGEEKNKYGTLGNVFLSNTELEELNGRLGVGKVSRLIDDLSEHMASTGKTYLSHYATLLRWSKNEYAPKPSEYSAPNAINNSEINTGETNTHSSFMAPYGRELSPQVTEVECDSQSASLGNGYEERTARGLFPPSKTVPLSPGERQEGECDSQSASLGNGYEERTARGLFPHASLREGGGLRSKTEGECDKNFYPLVNGYEERTARGLFPPSKTVPLSPGERQVGECEKSSYPLGNGYARRYDAWDSFNSRSGDYANKKSPRDKPREPKSRYGDFDPEEAMRLAIERTMRECGGGYISAEGG